MSNFPITSSAPQPVRPKPISSKIRSAIRAMVMGAPGDAGGVPLNFIEAARSVGLRPSTLRRAFDRADVVALLRRERRAQFELISAANGSVLQQIRDNPEGNQMARVASIRCLEELGSEPGLAADSQSAGITITIVGGPPAQPQPLIDVTPRSEPLPESEQLSRPGFRWPK
jgi:hypothetical protein